MPSALRLAALGLATLAGLAAVAVAGLRLQQGPSVPLAPPPAGASRAAELPPSAPGAPGATDEAAWPALFGTAPPVPEAPAAPPRPGGSYALRGIVAGDGGGWAIIADGGREVLVRPGDEIEPGWTIARIAHDQVLIASGDTEVAIGFAEGAEVRTVEVAAAAGAEADAADEADAGSGDGSGDGSERRFR